MTVLTERLRSMRLIALSASAGTQPQDSDAAMNSGLS